MVKALIIFIGVILCMLEIFNSFQWYCSELTMMGNLKQMVSSVCFLNDILYTMLAVGLLSLLHFIKKRILILILSAIIILEIIILSVNSGAAQLILILEISLGFVGKFLGIFLGILYFNKIVSIELGLVYLILGWFTINVMYPIVI